MSLPLIVLFLIAGGLAAHMFFDLFKDIPKSKEVLPPLEADYLLAVLFRGPLWAYMASTALKAEEAEFIVAQAEWQQRFAGTALKYDIERRQDGISITVRLTADADATINVALPARATRADVLLAGMAEVARRWHL
jgi:hypothetical protein